MAGHRGLRRGLVAGLLAATALGIGATGCTTHDCDPNSSDFFGGQMLDENTFVTGGWYDPWLPYPPNTTIRIWFPPEVAGRTPRVPSGLVGVDQTPNGGPDFANGDNWTVAAGQLAYYNFLQTNASVQAGHAVGGGFSVTNATCAKGYYARFEVDFLPLDSDAGAGDEAGPSDGPEAGDAGDGNVEPGDGGAG